MTAPFMERFIELGVDDYVWDDERGFADWSRANPEVVQHASLEATV